MTYTSPTLASTGQSPLPKPLICFLFTLLTPSNLWPIYCPHNLTFSRISCSWQHIRCSHFQTDFFHLAMCIGGSVTYSLKLRFISLVLNPAPTVRVWKSSSVHLLKDMGLLLRWETYDLGKHLLAFKCRYLPGLTFQVICPRMMVTGSHSEGTFNWCKGVTQSSSTPAPTVPQLHQHLMSSSPGLVPFTGCWFSITNKLTSTCMHMFSWSHIEQADAEQICV